MIEGSAEKKIGYQLDERSRERSHVCSSLSFGLGVTRYFGGKGFSNVGLISGWAAPEPEHNWNDGCETVFQMLIDDPAGSCTIECRGEPFINHKCHRQDIILHANGFHVGYWRLTKPSTFTLLAKVEKEQLFSRGDAALLRLVWSFPDSTSPLAQGLSNDSRVLAFCFRSILISKP